MNFAPPIEYAFGIYKRVQSQIENDLLKSYAGKDVQLPPEILFNFPNRIASAMGMQRQFITSLFPWLIHDREDTNYTLNLHELNKTYLASLVSVITKAPLEVCESYFRELEEDHELKEHISLKTAQSVRSSSSSLEARFGRRLGWYAIARCIKPKLVVESGVDKGLGSCVLCAALLRNAEEGSPGKYTGIDIETSAGFLLDGKYKQVGEIVYADSVETLLSIRDEVDFFISDSCHEEEYERKEYAAIETKLSREAIVISDTTQLPFIEFARRTERRFLSFTEQSTDHWHPGTSNGIAFV